MQTYILHTIHLLKYQMIKIYIMADLKNKVSNNNLP